MLESQEVIHNRIKYTGEQHDNLTNQYYLRARFYNPLLGRFLQEDTYRGDGLNLYAYCDNNPVMYYDPSGYAMIRCVKEAFHTGKNVKVNGITYTKHALERMAPNTNDVIFELVQRYSKNATNKVGTIDYFQEIVKKISTRNVSFGAVEEIISKGIKKPSRHGGPLMEYEFKGIRVIFDEVKRRVVTVIKL
jgi:RHS repeat-associated protein